MKKTVLIVGILVACLGVSGMAQAKPKRDYNTKVSLRAQSGNGPYSEYAEGFTGKVKSASKCRSGRRVTVFQRGGGRVGSDVTNRQGQYAVPVRGDYAENGRYFAEAKRKNLRGPRDCKAGTSPTVRVTAG